MDSNWSKGIVHWCEDGVAYVSVVFSWDLAEAYQRCAWYAAQGYDVRAGGPAVSLNPGYLADVAEIGGDVPALHRHNALATKTSVGCPHRCRFCGAWRIDEFRELDDWEPKPLVCDNNLLACSLPHFDRVIDRLKGIQQVDFNQGFDARLLTDYHADRVAELDVKVVRLAWDHVKLESAFMAAYERLRRAGFWKERIRVYVLIGFDDTPADALYRLETVKGLRSWPNPMRYQPLDVEERNGYVAPGWTDGELKRFMRYWSRQRWLASVPFEEYRR